MSLLLQQLKETLEIRADIDNMLQLAGVECRSCIAYSTLYCGQYFPIGIWLFAQSENLQTNEHI